MGKTAFTEGKTTEDEESLHENCSEKHPIRELKLTLDQQLQPCVWFFIELIGNTVEVERIFWLQQLLLYFH